MSLKDRLASLEALIRSPIRRHTLGHQAVMALWPLVSPLGWVYRATVGRRTRLVAVTGSFGKTTTTRALETVLDLPQRPRINLSTYLLDTMLRTMPWQRLAVMEVGIIRPGQMAGFAAVLRPNIAVVTSIGSEHQRSLLTLERTRQEKSELLAALPPDGLAVLNGDDPNVLWMRSRTRARVVTFGLGEANDVRASRVQLDWPHGLRFTLHLDGRQYDVHTRLLGQHQVASVLAAVAVAREADVPVEQTISRLERFEAQPGRLQLLRTPSGVFILRDDFKSTFETIETSLATLAEIPVGRRFLVLGEIEDPPPPAGPLYRQLGALAARTATRVLLFGGTGARSYRSGLQAGGLDRDNVSYLGPSVRAAIDLLQQELRPGDLVLLKGQNRQRLGRVALGLLGRSVRCDLPACPLAMPACDVCPYLERGWTRPPTI